MLAQLATTMGALILVILYWANKFHMAPILIGSSHIGADLSQVFLERLVYIGYMDLFMFAFVSSLMGSLHCLGMCGPLNTFVLDRSETIFRPTVLYHGGRLVAYLLLTSVAYFVGMMIDHLSWLQTIQRVSFYLGASFLMLSGFLMMGLFPQLQQRIQKIMMSLPMIAKLQKVNPRRGGFPLVFGFLTGFLPCVWLYAFIVSSMAMENYGSAILYMVAFWLGSLPVMILPLGVLSLGLHRLKARLPRLVGGMLVMGGLWVLYSRTFLQAFCHH